MKYPLQILLLVPAIVGLLAACSKNDDGSSSVDVYAFGHINMQAVYWKNGQMTPVGGPQFTALGFAVSGNDDVYVTGYETRDTSARAMIWKNGQLSALGHGLSSAMADGITIVGSDVYVAGSERTGNGTWTAVYWKNGLRIPLESDPAGSRASSVAVAGSDVYVVGQRSRGTASGMNVNAVWKNGRLLFLSDSNRNANRCSITESQGNIYTVSGEYLPGRSRPQTSFARNLGVPVIIGDDDIDNLIGSAIAAEAGRVYVAGWGEIRRAPNALTQGARYWNDGTLTRLTAEAPGDMSYASSIAVDGSDVYVGGWSGSNGKMAATYWKNGNPVYPADTTGKSLIHQIIVRRK